MPPTQETGTDAVSDFPPAIARRISRLRWTAGLLWIVWLLITGFTYWSFRTLPHTPELIQLVTTAAVAIGTIPIWFAFTIYRIGALADASDAGSD